ncbi:MAG: TIGR00730 family Rossman fold protein [Paludibacteraceae bacterium]|nr:TIGR00730 family Rossman fold protein [Paludibacteraceae bacterium]
MKTIAVYCSSSNNIPLEYVQAAEQLGTIIGAHGLRCCNGGGSMGLMRVVSDSVLQHGGEVVGVIPQFMIDNGWCHSQLTEVVATDTMHHRQETMHKISDALVALPGGVGTFLELIESITWKQLGIINMPIVIVNINHYFDPLIKQLELAVTEGFMHPKHGQMWTVVDRVGDVLKAIRETPEWDCNFKKTEGR